MSPRERIARQPPVERLVWAISLLSSAGSRSGIPERTSGFACSVDPA